MERPSLIPPIPKVWNHPQETFDWRDLQLARVAAAYIRLHPQSISFARANLEKWEAQAESYRSKTDSLRMQSVHQFFERPRTEWIQLFDTLSPNEIADLLEEESSNAQRLRSSSPFIGEPFLHEEWVAPFRVEIARARDIAAKEYKVRFQERERLLCQNSKVPNISSPESTLKTH